MKNPYSVLGVSRTDDADVIKKAYKKLARQYHPDVNKDPGAAERFNEVNEAWDVLQDPQKRKNYDTFGAATGPGPQGFGRGAAASGSPFSGFNVRFDEGGGIDMEDVLSSMFGAGAAGGGFRRNERGRDQQASLTLDPMMAITGGETTLVVSRPGGGRDTLKVRIPAGVEDGKSLRLRGQGLPPSGGGPAGDLHIRLTIPPHPLLRRSGKDLELDVPITIKEAVAGAEIVVPTPTGDVKVKVPPGARGGQKLRLRGRGVQLRKGGAGDLYLVLLPTMPPVETPELEAAVDALEAAYEGSVRAELKLA
jgi:DnaJ-class molecular chaperone